MTATEFNRDYWCVASTLSLGRRPVSFSTLQVLLGSKIYLIMRKLEQNKNEKFVVRPFHGEVYTFYRH